MVNDKLFDIQSDIRDIKRDLKLVTDCEIKSTHSNSWSIRNTIDSILKNQSYLKTNYENIGSIMDSINNFYKLYNKNIVSVNENSDSMFELLEEINTKLDIKESSNEQLKSIILEKLYQLGQDDSVETFRNKMNELEILVKNIK